MLAYARVVLCVLIAYMCGICVLLSSVNARVAANTSSSSVGTCVWLCYGDGDRRVYRVLTTMCLYYQMGLLMYLVICIML